MTVKSLTKQSLAILRYVPIALQETEEIMEMYH